MIFLFQSDTCISSTFETIETQMLVRMILITARMLPTVIRQTLMMMVMVSLSDSFL